MLSSIQLNPLTSFKSNTFNQPPSLTLPLSLSKAPFSAQLDALHELIAQYADASLELRVRLRVPLGSRATGDGVGAGEGDVEHVGGFVPVIAVHAGAEAGGGERDGGFANKRSAAIGSVGVAPYAVDLESD